MVRRQLCVPHGSPVPLDDVAPPGNDLGAAGAKTLRPALGKLTNLTTLHLRGACGDMCSDVRLSESSARVSGVGGGGRSGQAVVVVVCDGLFACDM